MLRTSNNWTAVFNQFNPWLPVSGEQIDTLYVEREDSVWRRLEISMRPNRVAHKVILVGQRGSGKTSELFKLISKMQEDYHTIYVDLYGSLEVSTASKIEVITCLGAAIYKSAKDAGFELSGRLWDDLLSSISTVVREQIRRRDFELDPVGLLSTVICTAGAFYPPLSTVGEAVHKGLHFSFGIARSDTEKLELEPVLREVNVRVNAILEDVADAVQKPVLLIADGLDKMADLQQASFIFTQSWLLTALACRAVYVAPAVLYYSTLFKVLQNDFDCEELPNVRLHPHNSPHEESEHGYRVMTELVQRRLTEVHLSLEDVFTAEALRLLITMSGGVMRDLVALVREAAVEAERQERAQVDLDTAQAVVQHKRRSLQAPLFEEHYRALAEIQKSGGLIDRGDPAQMELLRDGYVVSYANGGFWRDLHPIIVPLIDEYRMRQAPSGAQELT